MKIENNEGNISIPEVFYAELVRGQFPVNPIAFNVVIGKDLAWWQDTGHGHSVKIKTYKILDDSLELTLEDNTLYRMKKLTLDIFNQKVKSQVAPIGQEFKTDKELCDYYLDTNFYFS